ncbi:MAG: STAS domain-containing protein [Thermoguttaceae bacterium]
MPQEPFFDARLIDDDILAVLLRGSLDSTTTEDFDREIQRHLDEGRSRIIIDCRYLDNLTSMGIGRLVALQTKLRRKGGAVKLASIYGPAAEVIQLVGLGKILEIYGDLEFARESFYA